MKNETAHTLSADVADQMTKALTEASIETLMNSLQLASIARNKAEAKSETFFMASIEIQMVRDEITKRIS